MNGRFVKLLAGAALGSVAMFGATVSIQLTYDSSTPFIATVNGVANTKIICDDDKDTVYVNGSLQETWQATSESLATINAVGTGGLRFAPVGVSIYDAVGWLALQVYSNASAASAIQTAIWQVMDNPSDTASFYANVSNGFGGTGGWEYKALTSVLAPGQANEIIFLTPISGTQRYNGSTPGLPQEFIMITPEPATYALFGMGIILLSLGTFRRGAKRTN